MMLLIIFWIIFSAFILKVIGNFVIPYGMMKLGEGKSHSFGIEILLDLIFVLLLTLLSHFVDADGIMYSPLSAFLIISGIVLFSYVHFFIVAIIYNRLHKNDGANINKE